MKKSDAAAREAIHELFKYSEAIKENISLKDDEIRLIVVSTEWTELLRPFSSFVDKIDYKTDGYLLKVNSDKTLSADKIIPEKLIADRLLSAMQMARYYNNENLLKSGITSHLEAFKKHGINDFVLIILKAPENYKEMVKASIRATLQGLQERDFDGELSIEPMDEGKLDKIPDHKYMIYSTNQLLSKENYISVLKEISDYPEQIEEIITNEESTESDMLEEFNAALINCEPFPESDYVEIGTPSKFTEFTKRQGWQILEVKRYGKISENIVLEDESIIEEVKGSAGTSGQIFKSNLRFGNKSNISRVKREMINCLSNNRIWRNHILHILDELQERKDIVSGRCYIYNPMNILYSIYLNMSSQETTQYIPSYFITIECSEEERLYVGYLSGKRSNVSFSDIINKFYKGDLSKLILSRMWNCYNSQNIDLCKYMGVEYKTALIVKRDEKRFFFKFEDYNFESTDNYNPMMEFFQYYELNSELCNEIHTTLDRHFVEDLSTF